MCASVKITVCSTADHQRAVHQREKTFCVLDNSRRRFPRPCKRSTASSTRAPFTVMSIEHCYVITKVVCFLAPDKFFCTDLFITDILVFLYHNFDFKRRGLRCWAGQKCAFLRTFLAKSASISNISRWILSAQHLPRLEFVEKSFLKTSPWKRS